MPTETAPDTIKIAKSFVDRISDHNNYKNCAVLKHIISMANAPDLVCLTEDAEEKEQVDMLSLQSNR